MQRLRVARFRLRLYGNVKPQICARRWLVSVRKYSLNPGNKSILVTTR